MNIKEQYYFFFFSLLVFGPTFGQKKYTINIDIPEKEIIDNHLDLGGYNLSGDKIDVNNYFITYNDRPFFPIMGEMHYSRYPEALWEESIKKIKAGGINVIATYVFWNIHERNESEFDWSKNLNLRKFVELCKKHDIYVIVRMGPFCHGEMRNGGVPDWLYGRSFEVRSNDERYLEYVDRLYGQIGEQIDGLLFKDGGPIIGVQLENEFQHSAAPWEIHHTGSRKEYVVSHMDAAVTHEQITVADIKNTRENQGKAHMLKLKELAIKHGINVPIYTATGWGNATIVEKGSIPVTAGYPYPFWAEPEPSTFYLFKDIHKYPDYMPVSYETELYPSIAGEMGPGIQSKYSRRPIVDPISVEPLMVRTVGSGSNGIGYYMYHGGSTPVFDGKFYNEDINGLPKVNYDFQAPIGQYGQLRAHYHSLKLLHMFLGTFGEILAPMKTVLPKENENIKPQDVSTLRYAVRSYKDSGFLFLNNFQDHVENKNIEDVSVTIKTANETIAFPSKGTFSLNKDQCIILPFNLKWGKVTLKSATVQPLTRFTDSDTEYFVFYSIKGLTSEIVFKGNPKVKSLKNVVKSNVNNTLVIKLKKEDKVASFVIDGKNYLIIPKSMALNSYLYDNRLWFSQGGIVGADNELKITSQSKSIGLYVYPGLKNIPKIKNAVIKRDKTDRANFTKYKIDFKERKPKIEIKKYTEEKYAITLNDDLGDLNDIFLKIDYVGDLGMAFIDGLMVNDHYYQEREWEISLRQFLPKMKDKEMVLVFRPMYTDAEFLKDLTRLPDFGERNDYLDVKEIRVVPEYTTSLSGW